MPHPFLNVSVDHMRGDLAEARDFLSKLAAAERIGGLYPEGHPLRTEAIAALVDAAGRMVHEGPIDLFVHEGSFFAGEKLLVRESVTLKGLMRVWVGRGIASLSIRPDLTSHHVKVLLSFLSLGGDPPTGPIGINQAELSDLHIGRAGAGLMKSAYGNALEILRRSGIGEQPISQAPAGAAKEAVEGLVEGVITDPQSALLLATMHSHDEYTFFHMVNVCILSLATGAAAGLSRGQLETLGLGAILHDMGKVAVPFEVLNRSGALAEHEWEQIMRHPAEGALMMLSAWDRLPPAAASIAFEHHVHLDGSGYPHTHPPSAPNIFSRIVSVADTFDAITSRRSYRRAERREKALEVLLTGADAHYDPRVVRIFIRILGFYPPGSVVEMSDDTMAVVVKNNPKALSAPVVRILSADGSFGPELHLADHPSLRILRSVDQSKMEIDIAAIAP